MIDILPGEKNKKLNGWFTLKLIYIPRLILNSKRICAIPDPGACQSK